MKNALTYKNYHGSVEFSAEDQLFYGKILGIRDVVTFEGTSVTQTWPPGKSPLTIE